MEGLTRFYETEYTLDDLTAEEMAYFKDKWAKLDDFDRDLYDDFVDFVESAIADVCYPED